MTTTPPQLSLTHVVDAPRAGVYRAFTDPDQFAAWWGPFGNTLPRDEVEFDLRAGGSLQWAEYFPDRPGTWTRGRIDLTEVVEDEALDGIMRITGELPGGWAPFETRMRIEFHDEPDGRTRLEIFQWLPDTHVAPTRGGWGEALTKLEAVLSAGAPGRG
ncbi:MAG TPA: SRPBCC domain-containing protein [Acidimicrobiales bacterium]|nr:SRPBCC domain-containing protein [Acidimicrobiales bacterium]